MSELLDQPGVRVGHATDREARTGVTVIAFDRPALTAAEVRGAAPGTREIELLQPGRLVRRADAIVFSGGSAMGLRSVDGVVSALADAGRGFETSIANIPIVPAAIIFDLAVGEPVAPTVEMGREAWSNAKSLSLAAQGQVGAGTGATWGKIVPGQLNPGGIGIAQQILGEYSVTAIVVLNAMGVFGGNDPRPGLIQNIGAPRAGESTTLISVITDHPCDHETLGRLCVAAHDGLARKVIPAHTMFDGDVAFASTLAERTIEPRQVMSLCMATELAVESAIDAAADRS